MKANYDPLLKMAILLVIGAAVLFTQPRGEGAGQTEQAMPEAHIGDNVVKLEVASSPQEIEHGLMGRTALAENHGMIFVFHPARAVNFWMYHTLISLDMIFVRDGTIIKIFADVPPCRSENPSDCPTYPAGPGLEASEVIEVEGGYSAKHKIKAGDKVSFEMPPGGNTTLSH